MKKTLLTVVLFLAGTLLLMGCNTPLIIEIGIPSATPRPDQPRATIPPKDTATPLPRATHTAPPPAEPTSTRPTLTIALDPLPAGAVYTSPGPVTLYGKTSQMPFEKTLGYRVFDSNGEVVQSGPVTVEGEYGGPGEFTLNVLFQPTQSGSFTIQIFNESAQNGEITASAETKVTLNASQPAGMLIKINPLPNEGKYQAPATVNLSGTVNPIPFEKQMAYQVYDAQNSLVDQGQVTVEGEYGSEGKFAMVIPFDNNQHGEYVIRVVDFSAKDGSVNASAEVKITIE